MLSTESSNFEKKETSFCENILPGKMDPYAARVSRGMPWAAAGCHKLLEPQKLPAGGAGLGSPYCWESPGQATNTWYHHIGCTSTPSQDLGHTITPSHHSTPQHTTAHTSTHQPTTPHHTTPHHTTSHHEVLHQVTAHGKSEILKRSK